jgi:thiol:disulfide interchange protein DsbC
MKLITTLCLLSTTLIAFADASDNQKIKFEQAIQNFSKQNFSIHAINDTPINGIKEIVVKNGLAKQIIYMSEDGEYLLDGKLMNLKDRKNLTEQTENNLRSELLKETLKNHKSIEFIPENMTDHITVFTDIDCGFCRKLHQEVDAFNEMGIGVSYLFFPRAGLNTASHQKAVNVWCATDQQKAMTLAKNGKELPPLMCPNPIEKQYNLGISAGIHKIGTPAVIFSNGAVTGYLPAEAMKQRIELNKNN